MLVYFQNQCKKWIQVISCCQYKGKWRNANWFLKLGLKTCIHHQMTPLNSSKSWKGITAAAKTFYLWRSVMHNHPSSFWGGRMLFFYLKGQSNSSMTTTFWLGGLVQWQQYAFGWYCDEVLSTILALSEFILDIYSFNFNAHFGFQHSHLLELLFSLVLLCEFLYASDMPKYFMEMGSHPHDLCSTRSFLISFNYGLSACLLLLALITLYFVIHLHAV